MTSNGFSARIVDKDNFYFFSKLPFVYDGVYPYSLACKRSDNLPSRFSQDIFSSAFYIENVAHTCCLAFRAKLLLP